MSKMGVLSRKSAPKMWTIGPFPLCSMRSSFTQVSPSGFGRKGLRVAKTPTRSTPPKRGGRTVGDHWVSRCFRWSTACAGASALSCALAVLTISAARAGALHTAAPATDAFAVLSTCALSRVLASDSMSQAVPPGNPFSNCQISQRCENPSSPATAVSSANSGSKIIRPCRCGARKLLRGMPNFCGRSVRICAIGFMFMRAIVPHCGRNFAVKRCAGVRSLLKYPFGINQGRHV